MSAHTNASCLKTFIRIFGIVLFAQIIFVFGILPFECLLSNMFVFNYFNFILHFYDPAIDLCYFILPSTCTGFGNILGGFLAIVLSMTIYALVFSCITTIIRRSIDA
jgi:hypothetical protein